VLNAAKAVLEEGSTVRGAAAVYDVHYLTLSRYIQKMKDAQEAPKCGYQSSRHVFSDEQEDAMALYLPTASDLYYGVSPKEAHVLAFPCAVEFNIKCPEQCASSQSAGEDSLYGFMSTRPSSSVRMPEARSLARETSFNKTTAGLFFKKTLYCNRQAQV